MVGLLLMLVMGTGCVIIDVDEMQACRLAAAEPAEATACVIDAGVQSSPIACHQEW